MVGGIASFFVFQENFQKDLVKKKNPDWNVSIRFINSKNGEEAALMKEIRELAALNLKSGSSSDLKRTASQIIKLGAFAQVNAVRTSQSAVMISLRLREPFLVVDTGDKRRFLTVDGDVYEDQKKSADNWKPERPVIHGIFSHNGAPLVWNEQNLLVINQEQKRATKEAVALYQALVDQKVDVVGIQHLRFRGFVITLRDANTEVTVGYGPFKEKLVKLKEIIAHLQKTGSKAARIELDFQGKAFIKERKI